LNKKDAVDRNGQPASSEAITKSRGFHLGLYFLLLLCGLSIFVISSFTSGELNIQTFWVPLSFLAVALWMKRSVRFKRYWEIFFAFFIFSFVWLFRHSVLDSYFVHPFYSTLNGNVIAQLIDSSLVIASILVLTRVSGGTFSSIFLRRGNLRLAVIVGLPVLGIMFFVSVGVAQAIGGSFGGQAVNIGYLLTLTPYLLVLSLSNGIKEELWFRGLFLNKYEALLGARLSNFLQAPMFAASLVEAEFAPALLVLVIIAFGFGLGSGYLMRKTNGILGSSLCEAGFTIPAFLILISTLR
jgi:membrane protease YdiL (CAAX protease family)